MAKDPTPPFVRRPKASPDRTAIADEARQRETLPPPTDAASEKGGATDPPSSAGPDVASEIDPAFASAVDRVTSDVMAERAERADELTDLTRAPHQDAQKDDGRPDVSGVDLDALTGLRPPSTSGDWTPLGDRDDTGPPTGKDTSLISDANAPTNPLTSAQGSQFDAADGVKAPDGTKVKDAYGDTFGGASDHFVTGPKGSPRAEALQQAMDEMDGKTTPAAAAPAAEPASPPPEPTKGRVVIGSDGTIVSHDGEGKTTVKKPDGTKIVQNPDGSIDQTNPDKSTEHTDAPGSGWFDQPDPENEHALPPAMREMIRNQVQKLKDQATPQTGEDDGDIDFGDDPDGVHAPIDRGAALPDHKGDLLGGGQLGDAPDLDFGGSPATGPNYNGDAGAIDWGPDAASGGPQSGPEIDPLEDMGSDSTDLGAGRRPAPAEEDTDAAPALVPDIGEPTLYSDLRPVTAAVTQLDVAADDDESSEP